MLDDKLKESRFYCLDIARGLAIIWIILFHLMEGGSRGGYGNIIDAVMSRGYLGVDIFFMISGYSIYSSFCNHSYDLDGFTFLRRRLVRIYIPYWWSLIFAGLIVPIIIALLMYIRGHLSSIPWRIHYSITDWLEVITLIRVFFAHRGGLLSDVFWPIGPIWYIAIIVQIYIVIFLIITLRVSLLRASIVLSFMSLLTMFPTIKNIIPVGIFLPFWIEFATGILLFYMIHRVGYSWYLSNRCAVIPPIMLGIMFVVLYVVTGEELNICLLAVSVAYIVYPYDHIISTMLPAKIIAFVGKISYSLYMIHIPLLWIILPYIYVFRLPRYISERFVCVFLVIVIGYVWYLFFEKAPTPSATALSLANPLSAISSDLAQKGIVRS